MAKSDYSPALIEFVTVAVPFCAALERAGELRRDDFLDRLLHLAPLLYLKALMLSDEAESPDPEDTPPEVVTEAAYEELKDSLSERLAEKDDFLEAQSDNMRYSTEPLHATISECLADVYQPVANLVAVVREENTLALPAAVALCCALFAEYWGDRLLAVARALHRALFYTETDNFDEPDPHNHKVDLLRHHHTGLPTDELGECTHESCEGESHCHCHDL